MLKKQKINEKDKEDVLSLFFIKIAFIYNKKIKKLTI